jgi:hypothetical protein
VKWVNRNIANDYSVWQEEELLGYLREKFFIFIFIFEIRKRNVGVATVARWIISQRDAATSVKLCRWDEFRFGSFFFPPVFLLFFSSLPETSLPLVCVFLHIMRQIQVM